MTKLLKLFNLIRGLAVNCLKLRFIRRVHLYHPIKEYYRKLVPRSNLFQKIIVHYLSWSRYKTTTLFLFYMTGLQASGFHLSMKGYQLVMPVLEIWVELYSYPPNLYQFINLHSSFV